MTTLFLPVFLSCLHRCIIYNNTKYVTACLTFIVLQKEFQRLRLHSLNANKNQEDWKSRIIYRTEHNPQKGREQRIQCWADCCHHGTKFIRWSSKDLQSWRKKKNNFTTIQVIQACANIEWEHLLFHSEKVGQDEQTYMRMMLHFLCPCCLDCDDLRKMLNYWGGGRLTVYLTISILGGIFFSVSQVLDISGQSHWFTKLI